ncbi:MAG: hypothetical protein IKQ87_06375 [Clostridia bacterium]|jgi:hypothetical protein|nr:hypothetical protein [Clostridia bacterium]
MIEDDTVKLLRECDAGARMGIDSIGDVLPYVTDGRLRDMLSECRAGHEVLKAEIGRRLTDLHDDGKSPGAVARSMSWMKTGVKLAMNDSDRTVADLMTDGCNMGVKSLSRYLNQYRAADPECKDVTHRLIDLEAQLSTDMRPYL